MKRIICIGNRYVAQDAAGFEVCQRLQQCGLPPDLEVIDGGLAGLNLLALVDGMERVIFVDNVAGFDEPGTVMVLDARTVAAVSGGPYDHAAGLPYLLRILPEVCEAAPAEIKVIGLEGLPTSDMINRAVALALELTA